MKLCKKFKINEQIIEIIIITTGLLFARTLDPAMESPVPAAYAYKLLLFFIPSSGGKNAAISGILAHHGSWVALAGKESSSKNVLFYMDVMKISYLYIIIIL